MNGIKIGWSSTDLSPQSPVLIAGQFCARVSEGVADPITATVLALDNGNEQAVMVCCDLCVIPDNLRDKVREQIHGSCPDLDPRKIIFNATHTHTGPEIRTISQVGGHTSTGLGVELAVMPIEEYLDYIVKFIAQAVADAWNSRKPGKVAYGEDFAVVGRNRRWVNDSGVSQMYGNTDTPKFRHIEGYEDHSVGVLATCNENGDLTGLIVNVPSPSQVSESDFVLSADYWHETRQELRRRLGQNLFVLTQCSAAGDQSPHLLYGKKSAARMLELKGISERQEIARRIAGAVEEIVSCIGTEFDNMPLMVHKITDMSLPTSKLTEKDVETAMAEAEELQLNYLQEKHKLENDPSLSQQPRWYVPVTHAYRRMKWFQAVGERFKLQQDGYSIPAEIHVLRLGDAVFASNPFEYYLDYGVYIKARSKAIQTFLVQLSGPGTYVPSERSVAGGGYGSIPASNPVGPEGGRALAETTVEIINSLWPED